MRRGHHLCSSCKMSLRDKYVQHTHTDESTEGKKEARHHTQCACCIFKANNNACSTLFCKCATSFNELISVNAWIVCILLPGVRGDQLGTLLSLETFCELDSNLTTDGNSIIYSVKKNKGHKN
jgi:hypothetical protein